MQQILEEIYRSVLTGDVTAVEAHVQTAIDQGVEPEVVLKDGLIAAVEEVGALFERGDYFVPEMLISARSMQAAMKLLRPLLVAQGVKPAGVIVLGTVKGDLHDIGKNLVAMMMEGAGFEVRDLGVNVPTSKFLEAIQDDDVDLLGMSALLTTTIPQMKAVIDAIETEGLRDKVKIMVGGASVTDAFARDIGADGFAEDANRAAQVALQLVGQGGGELIQKEIS